MAEEERSHSGGGGGGGFSSDTDRSGSGNQRKVPQRGLGVAQLEKIRLEEERKRAAPCIAPPIFRPRSPPSVPIRLSGNGGWCRLWNGDYNAAHRFFHLQQSASPRLDSSSLEHPSNQNIHAHNSASSWLVEYKMVGVKRACPFSLETPPPRSRFDESPSCSRRCTARVEPRNIYTSSSNPINGDFLTLAPASALPPSNSKHRFPIDDSDPQGFKDDYRSQVYDSGQSRSREEPLSFIPVRSDIYESCAPVRDVNGGKGETLDLNLKLKL